MLPLLIGFSAVVSLLLLAALALVMMRKARNARDGVQWPMGDRAVLATITDVQIRQGWKEGERWERSLWDGRLVRQRTWQTYYDVTAQWTYPQTRLTLVTFVCTELWGSSALANDRVLLALSSRIRIQR